MVSLVFRPLEKGTGLIDRITTGLDLKRIKSCSMTNRAMVLCKLIETYGQSLCDNHPRCEGLLRDYCSAYELEISVLLNALKGGFVARLRNAAPQTPSEVLLGQLIQQLQDGRGLSGEAARWAMESWALALGLLSNAAAVPMQPARQSSLPPASVPTLTSPPTVTSSAVGQALAAPRSPVAWKILASALFLGALIAVIFLVLYRPAPENGKLAEVERQARLGAEQRAETERQARLEAERQARLEAERQTRLEAERRMEAERRARLEAERQAQLEAERQARLEAERRAEAERQARLEAERRAEAERQAQLETKRKVEAERQAQLEAKRKAEVEQQAQREAERKKAEAEQQAGSEAMKVVRTYYQDLDNNDCESARQKRQQVSNNFCKGINNIDWFRVEKLEVSKVAEDSVTVDIKVTGRNYSESPQTWSGPIELNKIEGNWKILTLKNLRKE